jgi:hypothetical protein
MALVVLNPIGSAISMDAKDSEMGSFNGGEFVTFGSSPRAVLTAIGTTGSAGIAGVITFSTPTVTLTDTTGLFNPGLVGYSVTVVDAAHPIRSGTTGTLVFSSPNVTLTDAGGTFSANMVGETITVSNATAPGNNGTFVITAANGTTCTWVNLAGGATQAAPATVKWSTAANDGTFFITAATSNSISWSNATGIAQASGVVWTLKQTTVNTTYDVSAMDAMSNVWVNQLSAGIQTGWAGKRVYVTKAAVQNGITTPVYLVDNGTTNYGTQFGTWIGGIAGQNNVEVAVGPSTDQASGKLALYRAGDFGITLDSVASDLIPPTTAVPWLTGGGILAPGAQLYAQASTGLLTSVSSGNLAINAYFKGYATKLGYVNTQAPFNPAAPYASLYMILIEFNVVAA